MVSRPARASKCPEQTRVQVFLLAARRGVFGSGLSSYSSGTIPDGKCVPKISLVWNGGYVEWLKVNADVGDRRQNRSVMINDWCRTRPTAPSTHARSVLQPDRISLWKIIGSNSNMQVYSVLGHGLRNKMDCFFQGGSRDLLV